MKRNKKLEIPGPSREDSALDQFAELMIEKLETIKGNWKKPWFSESTSIWPQNFSGRQYNGMNATMLAFEAEKCGYELPVWCTFDRIEGLNGHKNPEGKWVPEIDEKGEKLPRVGIKKGAKSFPVFITVKTVINSKTKEKIKYEDYVNMPEDERNKYNVYPKLYVYNVFNIKQTNIEEVRPTLYENIKKRVMGEKPKGETTDNWSFPEMDKMIEDSKNVIVTPYSWVCPIRPTKGDDAYYSISKDEIVVPEKCQFSDGKSYYSVIWHEMAHSTGAESRLNRLSKNATFGSKEYAKEELVAELSAALVCLQYGLQKSIKEESIPYLQSWLKTLKEEPRFIKTVLLDVRKASSLIIKSIDKIKYLKEHKDAE